MALSLGLEPWPCALALSLGLEPWLSALALSLEPWFSGAPSKAHLPEKGAPQWHATAGVVRARGPTAETGPERALSAKARAAQKGLTSWQDPASFHQQNDSEWAIERYCGGR